MECLWVEWSSFQCYLFYDLWSLAVTLFFHPSYKMRVLTGEDIGGLFSALTENIFVMELAGCRANHSNELGDGSKFNSPCGLKGWLSAVHSSLMSIGFQRTLVAHSAWHGTTISISTLEKMTESICWFVPNSDMTSTGTKSQNCHQRSCLRGRLERSLYIPETISLFLGTFSTRFCPYIKHLSMSKSSLTLPKDTILKLKDIRTKNSFKRRVRENDYLFSTNPVPEILLDAFPWPQFHFTSWRKASLNFLILPNGQLGFSAKIHKVTGHTIIQEWTGTSQTPNAVIFPICSVPSKRSLIS